MTHLPTPFYAVTKSALLVGVISPTRAVIGGTPSPLQPTLAHRPVSQRVAEILADSQRVLEALRKAFETNTKSVFIAMRLAQCHKRQGDLTAAKAVVKRALGGNASDKKLNFMYSKLLLDTDGSVEELVYHLRRSFVPGDNNYDAQLLYARQLFIIGSRTESKQLFSGLARVRIPAEARDRILYPLEPIFHGQVAKLEAVYCFVARDGINDWVFATRASIGEQLWKSLAIGSRLSFRVGFTFKGTQAFEVTPETAFAVA
jgi:hypothetical protein